MTSPPSTSSASELPDRLQCARDPFSAMKVVHDVLQSARSGRNIPLEAEALNMLALCCIYTGDVRQARSSAAEAYTLADRLGDARLLVQILLSQATIAFEIGDYRSAREMSHTALYLVRGLESAKELETFVLISLGCASLKEGEYVQALNAFVKALENTELTGNTLHRAYVNGSIGATYCFLGDPDGALKHQLLALEQLRQTGDRYTEMQLHGDLGNTYLERREPAKAMESFHAQLALAEEYSLTTTLSRALSGLGNAHTLTGDLDKALEFENRALEISTETGETSRQAEIRCYIAGILIRMGNHSLALSNLNTALAVASRNRNPKIEVAVNRLLARIYDAMGDRETAYDHYKKYIATRDTILDRRKIREIVQIHADYHKAVAEREKETLRLKTERLEQELENTSQEITSLTTDLIRKKNWMERIRDELKPIARGSRNYRTQAESLIAEIDTLLKSSDEWHTFERQFHRVHQEFINRLADRFPTLTPTELKICSLLRVNYSTKDIARILVISPYTVDGHRSSIRRKIGLPADANLVSWIAGL